MKKHNGCAVTSSRNVRLALAEPTTDQRDGVYVPYV